MTTRPENRFARANIGPFKTATGKVNMPDPNNPGMRIVGYRVTEEEAGLSDGLFVLEKHDERAARADPVDAEKLRSELRHVLDEVKALPTNWHMVDRIISHLRRRHLLSGGPAVEAMWQDISSAPRDGTPILARSGNKIPVITAFKDRNWRGQHYGPREAYWYYSEFTHWTPLPAPPAALDALQEGGRDGR